jgi:IclR family transcriptional regulator, acetate operon repressor
MKLDADATVKSADRAFDILEFVGNAPEPSTFSQLLSQLGIPRSSLFHLLNNLLARNYLRQDAAGRYNLGDQIRQLADKLSAPSLATLVARRLRQFSDELNETSGFYVRVGNSVEVIASATSNQALAYTMKVGEQAPLYAVSGGKIALAHMSAFELENYLLGIQFEAFTSKTIRTKRQLREEIQAVHKDGFAYSREEFTPGIIGMATAVQKGGQFVGAVNLAIPAVRFSKDREVVFRRQLQAMAFVLAQTI